MISATGRFYPVDLVKLWVVACLPHASLTNGLFVLHLLCRGVSCSREDIKKVRDTMDPIGLTKTQLLEAGFATEDDIKKIEADVRQAVKKATNEALEAPLPEIDHLVTHILTGEVRRNGQLAGQPLLERRSTE